MPKHQELPITPISNVSSERVKTGDWKTFKPVLDEKKCIKCYLCWKYCPDVAIKAEEGEFPKFDLDHCKGCGVCSHECPKKAIEMVMEE